MPIYGTAILSICLVIGLTVGRWLGGMMGIDADVGGVGIAMLLLVLGCEYLHSTGRITKPSEQGISYWSSIYIPIVVAMAASQNVSAAVSGGIVAILAGAITVAICFGLVRVLSNSGARSSK